MGAGRFENPARKKESFDPMSEACIREITAPEASSVPSQMPTSTYVAAAKEALWNCNRNYARTWYKDDADPDDPEGNYAFQRLRQTWFTPSIKPKFKLQRDDKFYAIGSCFARGLESSLIARKMAVESAAPELIITLGLVEVWRDIEADVYLNHTPIPSLLRTQRQRYEFHLTSFAQNWANLEAIHTLLSRYGHPDLRIVVTVSPVPLLNTFSTMDIVVANTYAKSLLRTVAQEWATAHENVDYFPSYEIVLNSDRAAAWEPDLRHVKGAGAHHIMELFVRSYLE